MYNGGGLPLKHKRYSVAVRYVGCSDEGTGDLYINILLFTSLSKTQSVKLNTVNSSFSSSTVTSIAVNALGLMPYKKHH